MVFTCEYAALPEPDVWFREALLLAKLTLSAAQLGPGFRMCCLDFQKRELISWVCQKWFNLCSATNFIWFIPNTHAHFADGVFAHAAPLISLVGFMCNKAKKKSILE